jgi:hypothetical protein
MSSFRFNPAGELVPSDGEPLIAFNGYPSVPPLPTSLHELHAGYEEMMERGLGYGLKDALVSPSVYRTVQGMAQMRENARKDIDVFARGLEKSLFNMMRVCIDPYMPKVWRQVRFPRSKKKRIRKKWAKDRRNWKEFDVAYFVNPDAFRRIRYPDGRETLAVVRGRERENAVMYFNGK